MKREKSTSKNQRKVIKIVWDVTIGDEALFEDRLGLIQHAAEVIRKKGMTPKFTLVIHGPATKFMTTSLEGTKFENEKISRLPEIHRIMAEMSKKSKMRFIQCKVPMERNNISQDKILSLADISENVFFDLAVLQMKGYAYIPIYEL
ncbi:MAG: DsrE family protein [Thermoplasmata archaeon]